MLELVVVMVDGFIIELAVDKSIKWVHIIYIELSIATGEKLMDKLQNWETPLVNSVTGLLNDFIAYLPQIIGAILLLILGWLVARLVRGLATRLVKGFDRFTGLVRKSGTTASPKIGESSASVIGNIVYWITVLIFVTSAASLLGMNMFVGWLNKLVDHLPNILSGALIICAGVIFGNLAYQVISSTRLNMSVPQRMILARSAQFFTLVMLILIGVDQIGVDITAVITIMSVVVGAVLGGLAIAFGIGARRLVSNLLGVRYLNRNYQIGERIKIDEFEGTILEIASVAVVLDADQGRVTIPARLFSEQPSILVKRENEDV